MLMRLSMFISSFGRGSFRFWMSSFLTALLPRTFAFHTHRQQFFIKQILIRTQSVIGAVKTPPLPLFGQGEVPGIVLRIALRQPVKTNLKTFPPVPKRASKPRTWRRARAAAALEAVRRWFPPV